MRLKVIFLGYLRELTQMDQTFSKNLLDNENISQSTLEGYVSKIKFSMINSLNALRWEEMLNKPDDNQLKKTIEEDTNKTNATQEAELAKIATAKQEAEAKEIAGANQQIEDMLNGQNIISTIQETKC